MHAHTHACTHGYYCLSSLVLCVYQPKMIAQNHVIIIIGQCCVFVLNLIYAYTLGLLKSPSFPYCCTVRVWMCVHGEILQRERERERERERGREREGRGRERGRGRGRGEGEVPEFYIYMYSTCSSFVSPCVHVSLCVCVLSMNVLIDEVIHCPSVSANFSSITIASLMMGYFYKLLPVHTCLVNTCTDTEIL